MMNQTTQQAQGTDLELTNAQRAQRTAMENAAMNPALRAVHDNELLAAGKAALASIAPDATGDFRDMLLMNFSYVAGYACRDARFSR